MNGLRVSPPLARGAAEAYFLSVFALYAVAIFVRSAAPQLGDYTIWSYEGMLLHARLLGSPDFDHTLKAYPVPNSMTTVGIAVLALIFTWRTAMKAWLVIELCVFCICARALLREVEAPWPVWVIVPSTVFINVNFWYGFMNFQLGIALVLFLVAVLLRGARAEWKVGLILTALFLTHMIPFVVGAVLVLLYSYRNKRTRLPVQLIPTAVLCVWYIFARYLLYGDAERGTFVSTIGPGWANYVVYKVNSYVKSLGFINPRIGIESAAVASLGVPAYLLAFAVNGLLALLLAAALLAERRRAARSGARQVFVWATAVSLLPIYLVLPPSGLGVSDPGSRVLQVALALMITICAESSWMLKGAAVCAVALAAFGAYLFLATNQTAYLIHGGQRLPGPIAALAGVPFGYADDYAVAVQNGDLSKPVFPTGLFLNSPGGGS